jgi:hypothetical protein
MREEGGRWREGEVQLPKELLNELSVSGGRGFSFTCPAEWAWYGLG